MQRNVWALLLSTAASVAVAVGCALTGRGPDVDPGIEGPGSGPEVRVAEGALSNKRSALKVMIATRPVDDPVLGDDLWSAADEHRIDPETRQALEANGLRIGVIDGAMPPTVESLLSPDAESSDRIDPVVIAVPDGHATPISLCPDVPAERMTLFLSLENRAVGRDYEEAQGFVRVTATPAESGVALRIVPEIHHGNEQLRYSPLENVGPFEPEQFVMKDGRLEESFRDLAANLTLAPGQALIVGCWPDRAGSLGHFLMTEAESKSDRLSQSVLFLWATPAKAGAIPWVEPITPPTGLRAVDPVEFGLGAGPAGSDPAD